MVGSREGGAVSCCVCAGRYADGKAGLGARRGQTPSLPALCRVSDLQQIAVVWCDLAALLFGEHGEGGNKGGERVFWGCLSSGLFFTLLTRHDDYCNHPPTAKHDVAFVSLICVSKP